MFRKIFRNTVNDTAVSSAENENLNNRTAYENEDDVGECYDRDYGNYESNLYIKKDAAEKYGVRGCKNNMQIQKSSGYNGTKVKKEPYYIKMYINNINYCKEVKSVINPVLVEVLYRVVPSTDNGKGQSIDLNDEVKSQIAKSLKISVRQVKEQISNLVESGILLYSQKQIYKLNYRYFSKGYFYRWRKDDE